MCKTQIFKGKLFQLFSEFFVVTANGNLTVVVEPQVAKEASFIAGGLCWLSNSVVETLGFGTLRKWSLQS